LVDVAFVSPLVGFIGGMGQSRVPNDGGAVILRTDNGGVSWTIVYQLEQSRGFAWKLFPVSERLIFAALQSEDGTYRIAKSVDSGFHWSTVVVADDKPTGFNVQSVGFLGPDTGWVGGFFSGMYVTTNGGLSWQFRSMPDALINRFESVDGVLFTAGTRGPLRWKP
jgi:photosystem II stability/assembly factor-like uncharacterized protein